MLSIGLSTLRERWATFAAAFTALMLGSALLATMALVIAATSSSPDRGPGRYAAAPDIIRVPATLYVPGKSGTIDAQPLAQQPSVPPALIARVTAVATVVPDRTFYAQVVTPASGGRPAQAAPEDEVGHPWSAAAFAPYRLIAGHPPAALGQVVVSAATARPGERVTVFTAAGPRPYMVSGVTAPVSFESAVFFTDAEAARLQPHVDALVAYGPIARIRNAVGGAAQVLTGREKDQADPRAQQDANSLIGLGTLLGVATIVAGSISLFLVASTFNFAVAQRRKELALLRAVGATPPQVRRMILGEAAVVGVAGAAAGCSLGLAGGPLLARWLAWHGLAPAWFTVTFSAPSVLALSIAFVLGLGIAVTGVVAPSVRAGDVRPVEALRAAGIDRKAMTISRWLLGPVAVFTGIATLTVAGDVPLIATNLKTYAIAVLLLLAGFALLSPAVSRPLIRLATWPAARLRGPAGSLVRENTTTAQRRTAALVTPVLLTVGLTAGILGAADSIGAAQSDAAEQLVHRAEFVVIPAGTPGLSQAAVSRVRAIRDADVAVVSSTTIYATPPAGPLEGNIAVLPFTAQAVSPGDLSAVLKLPVASGSVAGLNDHAIIVDRSWGQHAGARLRVWLADGTPVSLRVAAVLSTSAGTSAFVTPGNARAWLASQIYVRPRPGASRTAVAAALAAATHHLGARAEPLATWTAAATAGSEQQTSLGLLVILGIAVVYSGIAILNTLAMATSERVRDLAALRLAGATRRQVTRLAAAEAALVVAVGVTLAAGAVATAYAGLLHALQRVISGSPLSIPWAVTGLTVAACASAALLASAALTRLAMRTRPADLAGLRP